jgi:hypothetical protein
VLFAQVASSIAREEAMKTRDSRLVLLLSALGLAAGKRNEDGLLSINSITLPHNINIPNHPSTLQGPSPNNPCCQL